MSEEEFELLLFRKTMNLTSNQKSSARKYYKDAYEKIGVIPEGLRYREGRKASGRKPSYSPELAKRFVEMVQKSSLAGIKDPDFITKELRTIENFRRRLKAEFGEIKPQTLYRLAKKHQLKEYLLKPDGEDSKNLAACFEELEVFDLIQMDGCNFHYFEIKNDLGLFKKPQAISFIDTGSRYIMAMDICFSESILNSIKAFELFLSSTVFPQKEIRFRPDNSSGFVNLKRVLNELNHKYAAPERFFFKSNFAKAGRPRHKAHIESSHRLLHGFEDFIMLNIQKDKLVERIQSFRINTSGHKEVVTISRYDINLSELKATGIIEAYLKEHNETSRLFSVSGQMEKWSPREKFETYLKLQDSFNFKKEDIQHCLKYGLPKEAATVGKDGLIRFNKKDFKVLTGQVRYYGKRLKIKVSEYNNKLYLFNSGKEGLLIGEAVLISEISPKTPSPSSIKLPANEFEHLMIMLKQNGFFLGVQETQRITTLFNQGLTLNLAQKILLEYQVIYDKYRKNTEFDQAQAGLILTNLFLTHAQNTLNRL